MVITFGKDRAVVRKALAAHLLAAGKNLVASRLKIASAAGCMDSSLPPRILLTHWVFCSYVANTVPGS